MKKIFTFCVVSAMSLTTIAQNQYSISLDGVNDYIDYSTQATIANFPISIQVDVKLPANFQSGDQFFVYQSDDSNGSYSGFWMAVHYNFIEISYGDGQGEGSEYRRSKTCNHTIGSDTWVNLTCIINSQTNMNVYQNGVELSGTYSGSGGAYISDLPGRNSLSGYSIGSSSQVFSEGKMDNLALWSKVLSVQEIQDYMTCPPTGNETNLVAFWNFEEGTGSTTADLTGNGHNGMLANAPIWSTDVPFNDCGLSVDEMSASKIKTLVKIVDELGREVNQENNKVQFYIYSDGSVEKMFISGSY